MITGSIVWYLRKAQKGSVSLAPSTEIAPNGLDSQGFSETTSLLKKIVRSTTENNLLTSILALVSRVRSPSTKFS